MEQLQVLGCLPDFLIVNQYRLLDWDLECVAVLGSLYTLLKLKDVMSSKQMSFMMLLPEHMELIAFRL